MRASIRFRFSGFEALLERRTSKVRKFLFRNVDALVSKPKAFSLQERFRLQLAQAKATKIVAKMLLFCGTNRLYQVSQVTLCDSHPSKDFARHFTVVLTTLINEEQHRRLFLEQILGSYYLCDSVPLVKRTLELLLLYFAAGRGFFGGHYPHQSPIVNLRSSPSCVCT